MNLAIGIVTTSFIYTIIAMLICLIITRSWIFFIFILTSTLVFIFLAVAYIKKHVIFETFGNALGKYFTNKRMTDIFCRLKNYFI